MDRWDILIGIAAGYVAIVSLVRLMANRRNELVGKIRAKIAQERDAAAAKGAAAFADEQKQDAA
jgi:hypothetical protein